mmetsp:Transcript_615/g.1888  ORF Transcript_615/g.1888 Transcript_615/m.1888 type:complete len:80 (+) Transcript_615:606-845(+)
MRRTYVFAKTPLVSTYLLALLVGEFDRAASTTPRTGVIASMHTVLGRLNEGRFRLEVHPRRWCFTRTCLGLNIHWVRAI